MTLLRSLTAVVATCACALALVACGSSDEDLAATRAALEPVVTEVAGMPGVIEVTIEPEQVEGVELAHSIDVDVITEATTLEALRAHADAVVAAVWRSEVPVISTIVLRVRPDQPGLTDAEGDRLEVFETRGRSELEDELGPRPGG